VGLDKSSLFLAELMAGLHMLASTPFGTTSVQLRSGNSVDFPCKRHQQSCLLFSLFALHAWGQGFESPHVLPTYQCEGSPARALRRSIPEGIQDGHVEMREIAFVPSGHGEAVNASCGGYHGILT
jgi:hypothetical protein